MRFWIGGFCLSFVGWLFALFIFSGFLDDEEKRILWLVAIGISALTATGIWAIWGPK